jgi:pyridoxal 5-phosphate dependent beta-lyase
MSDIGRRFANVRPSFSGIHLDSAAAGRPSRAVLTAISDHLTLESRVGGYVAAAQVEGTLEQGRANLASLLGRQPDEVALVESATAGLRELLAAWPLPRDGRVAVAPDEWGPNLDLFRAAGLTLVPLPTDESGVIDLEALEQLLHSNPPDVVAVTQVPSHRPLIQPVRAVAEICRATGTPLWVDAAQALGHVEVQSSAAAVFAPGRKWLTGPRGSGLIAIARDWWPSLRLPGTLMDADRPFIQRMESAERSTAVLVGFCTAVAEHIELGPSQVWTALSEVGQRTRVALADLSGWKVLPPAGGEAALTALEPLASQNVGLVREHLRTAAGILTTAAVPARAPRSMTQTLLRVSPHVDVTDDQLTRLADALRALR